MAHPTHSNGDSVAFDAYLELNYEATHNPDKFYHKDNKLAQDRLSELTNELKRLEAAASEFGPSYYRDETVRIAGFHHIR